MTTISIKLRQSSIEGREGMLCYQIIHKREVRRLASGYRLYPEEWDAKAAAVILPESESKRWVYLRRLQACLFVEMHRFRHIVKRIEKRGIDCSVDGVVEMFRTPVMGNTWFNGLTWAVNDVRRQGKTGLGLAYESAYRSFYHFRMGKDVMLSDVDAELIEEYEDYLRETGVMLNSISFYMRNLRAIYNRLVERQLVEQQYPFRRVYTGIGRTVKRAISLQGLRDIKGFRARSDVRMALARDLFLFSFYTRGMSFIDMAFLKKSDLKDGVLSYARRKTGQRLRVNWEPCMQQIVSKYVRKDSPYLLPIIRHEGNEWRQYKSMGRMVNRKLTKLGNILGLEVSLTMYCARHSWASLAKSLHVPLAIISESMGHDSEQTTQIYLTSLNAAEIDQTNRMILNML